MTHDKLDFCTCVPCNVLADNESRHGANQERTIGGFANKKKHSYTSWSRWRSGPHLRFSFAVSIWPKNLSSNCITLLLQGYQVPGSWIVGCFGHIFKIFSNPFSSAGFFVKCHFSDAEANWISSQFIIMSSSLLRCIVNMVICIVDRLFLFGGGFFALNPVSGWIDVNANSDISFLFIIAQVFGTNTKIEYTHVFKLFNINSVRSSYSIK